MCFFDSSFMKILKKKIMIIIIIIKRNTSKEEELFKQSMYCVLRQRNRYLERASHSLRLSFNLVSQYFSSPPRRRNIY